jgi:hypothetical protein
MSRTRLVTTIIMLVGLISVLLSIATNIATTELPESWQPHTWLAWPAVVLLTVMIIGLPVWQFRLDPQATEIGSAALTGQADPNRHQMLAKVRRDWIDDYLKHSLDNLARVELGLEEKPDAISRPWDAIVQQPDRAPRRLPPNQAMDAVFDDLDQALLILGAPGAGKTTLLLELTCDLLDRAEQDASYPIPVVFHLSS